MRYAIILLVLLIFSCKPKIAENSFAIPAKFKFSEKYVLSWQDFKGSPKLNTKTIALTNSGFEYVFEDKSVKNTLVLKFNVYSFFDGNKSWKLNDNLSDTILRHEEFHFLISELNARLLRMKIQKFRFSKNYDVEIKQIFSEGADNEQKMQDMYDEATEHSNNIENQKELERYILTTLRVLTMYSSETFELHTNVPITYSEVMSNKVSRSF